MKARVAGIAGSVLALTVIGGFAAASTFQSAAPVPVVQPAAVETVAPVVAPTTADPTIAAPAPVESTQAPAPKPVAPKPEVVVPKVVQPAPDATVAAGETLRYGNGELVKRSASGRVIGLLPKEPPVCMGAPVDGNGVPIPRPASCK